MPRPLVFLLISLLLAAASWSVQEPDADERILAGSARLQDRLDVQARELRTGAAFWAHELAELGADNWILPSPS